jgi:hypothetical protein
LAICRISTLTENNDFCFGVVSASHVLLFVVVMSVFFGFFGFPVGSPEIPLLFCRSGVSEKSSMSAVLLFVVFFFVFLGFF